MNKFTQYIEKGLKEEFYKVKSKDLFYETYRTYHIPTLRGEIEKNLDIMEEILSKFENREYVYKRNFDPNSNAFAIVNEPVYNYLKSYAIVKAGYDLLYRMAEIYQTKYQELKEQNVPVDSLEKDVPKPNWDEPLLDEEEIKQLMIHDASNYLFSDLNSYFVKWANVAGLHDITAYLHNIKTEMEEDNKKLATLVPKIASQLTVFIDENLYSLLRVGKSESNS